jgi:glutathione peroxidase
MSVFDVDLRSLAGTPMPPERFQGRAVLVVNVASQCGLTPQYAELQALAETYHDRGLVVLGVPCNQFGDQEPGTADEIRSFCETNYGVTFPMTEKVEVNGPGRHPLYSRLVGLADIEGHTGDIRWNFEKFLVGSDGEPVARYHPRVGPRAPELVEAIEKLLPA